MVSLLTEHMDIWTTAQTLKIKGGRGLGNGSSNQNPHGIKKLRELVLELAVRGKLVPQDPNDESANILLGKISKEKARLVREGKIKKQKSLPEIGEDEKPFELPKGWAWARLGNITSQITDGVHHTPKYIEKGVPFISVKDIDGKTISFEDCKYISKEQHKEINARCNPELGDLLICRIGTLGRVTIVDKEKPFSLFVSVGLLKFFKSQIIPTFSHLVLHSPLLTLQYEEIKAGGSHTNKLNLGDLPRLIIPLAPVTEQHRIVAKVNELMTLCDKLEQEQTNGNSTHQTLVETLLTTLTNAADQDEFGEAWQRIADHFDTLFTNEHSIDQLKQTILQLAVMGKLVPQDPNDEPASVLLKKISEEKARLVKEGKIKKKKPLSEINDDEKPFEVPAGWEWARPDDFSQKITDGEHFRPPTQDKGIYFLSAKDIRSNGVSLDDPLFISEETAEKALHRCNPEKGDLLIVSRGATVGRMCTVDIEDVFCLLGSVILIKPLQPILSEYLKIVMKTPQAFDQLVSASGSTAQPAIYLRDIRKIVFPIAPLTEQHRIVTKVDELTGLCEALREKIFNAQTTQAQLADAMAGHVLGG